MIANKPSLEDTASEKDRPQSLAQPDDPEEEWRHDTDWKSFLESGQFKELERAWRSTFVRKRLD